MGIGGLVVAASALDSPQAGPAIGGRLFNFRRTVVVANLLLAGGIISLSPILNAFSPLKGNIIALGSALAIVLIRVDWYAISWRTTALVLLLFGTGAISASYWGEPRVMLIPIYFVSSALAISAVSRHDIDTFVEVATWVLMAMLIGAIIGFLYAFNGGPALLAFTNPDGRLNELFLTTLTNSRFENFIRPAGFFDEPGALSFVVCCVAAMREGLGRDRRVTWAMLLLGLATMSLAHMVYMVVHGVHDLRGSKHVGRAAVIAAAVAGVLFLLVTFVRPVQELYSTYVAARFVVSDGRLAGDNRTDLLLNALKYLNPKSFWFGIDARCALNIINCDERGFAHYGENPLSLLVGWGLLISFPYYLGLIHLGWDAAIRHSLIPIGIFLLLLQRPYTMSYGYALLILLVMATLAGKYSGAARPTYAASNRS